MACANDGQKVAGPRIMSEDEEEAALMMQHPVLQRPSPPLDKLVDMLVATVSWLIVTLAYATLELVAIVVGLNNLWHEASYTSVGALLLSWATLGVALSRGRARHVCASVVLLAAMAGAAVSVAFHPPPYPQPGWNASAHPSGRVAVIGGGPAGSSAAWILKMGGRDVTIFEKEEYLGGHAYTHRAAGDGGLTRDVDMGFIFGKVGGYPQMSTFMDTYDIGKVETYLSVCSSVESATGPARRFCNFRADFLPKASRARWQAEIDRFMSLVHKYKTPEGDQMGILGLLTPFGLWLALHGFDDEFIDVIIQPVLSLLFVTKMGTRQQPAGAVLGYFSTSEDATGNGWVFLRKTEESKQPVWRVKGGSRVLYAALLRAIGHERIKLGTGISRVHRRADGKYELFGASRATGGGKSTNLGAYDQVVMATHADTSLKLLAPARLPLLSRWLLSQMQHTSVQVCLHSDTSFLPADESWRALYNVRFNPERRMEMTGRIGRIFGYEPTASERELLLTTGNQSVIEPSLLHRCFWWAHHTFDLWQGVLMAAVMPWVNGHEGIHFAGGWVKDIGHNSAYATGIQAGCAAGVQPAPIAEASARERTTYEKLLRDQCYK